MRKTKSELLMLGKSTLVVASIFSLALSQVALGAPSANLRQSIKSLAKKVDIVDQNGISITNPVVDFEPLNFSFESQTSETTLANSNQKIRVENPTGNAEWTLSLAASDPTALWTDQSNPQSKYDFNEINGLTDGSDEDNFAGQMEIDPTNSEISAVGACLATDIIKGSKSGFEEGAVNSIDILNAGANASPFCRWEMIGVDVSQLIPASQQSGDYKLDMVLTIS